MEKEGESDLKEKDGSSRMRREINETGKLLGRIGNRERGKKGRRDRGR